jgi:hypothetical protein
MIVPPEPFHMHFGGFEINIQLQERRFHLSPFRIVESKQDFANLLHGPSQACDRVFRAVRSQAYRGFLRNKGA